jgi:rubrerythrin
LRKSRRNTVAREQRIEQILKDAVESEIESYELYTHAIDMVEAEHVRQALRQLAKEELGHKATLERMLASPGQVRRDVARLQQAPIEDYRLGDHLVVKPLGPDSTFQDVCIYASKKEQESYELYHDMAEQNDGEIRDLFAAMAKEELRHKNLVEGWYEEVIYQDF